MFLDVDDSWAMVADVSGKDKKTSDHFPKKQREWWYEAETS